MGKFYSTGVVLKILMFVFAYFWHVSISTSGDNYVHRERSSKHVQPVRPLISNDLSDFIDFKDLESGISSMMDKFNIKGASVAVARDGELVFAKGIGYADLEAKEPAGPEHLFRIASVSKLVTATAIMKMAEMDMLDIDDRVFGKRGILNSPEYIRYTDPRIEKITVRHLLNHSGGWNNGYGDPLGMYYLIAREMNIDISAVKVSDILRYTLDKKLHFDPGSQTSYSNIGYAILGEIIETLTGMEYEAFVRQKILLPLGIRKMRIGKKYLADRFENEVKYYDLANVLRSSATAVPLAYGGNDIQILGAAGGWIASASDILKLVVSIDDATDAPNLLLPETIELMTDIRLSGGLPIGWAGLDGRGNWWRTGTLSGTSAMVMRQNNGITWAVFFNSSTNMGTRLPVEINREMQAALSKIEKWPDHNLFHYFEAPHLNYPEIAELL